MKETIAISIPFYLFYHFKSNKRNAVFVTSITFIFYLCGIYFIRKYAPISLETTRNNFWTFDLKSASINFYRLNSWFSLILSFGLVGLLFFKELFTKSIRQIIEKPLYLACLASIGSAIFLYLLSYFSTIADGRIIWLSYFYMLMVVNSSWTIDDSK